jgi:hypothetical protein
MGSQAVDRETVFSLTAQTLSTIPRIRFGEPYTSMLKRVVYGANSWQASGFLPLCLVGAALGFHTHALCLVRRIYINGKVDARPAFLPSPSADRSMV